MSDHPAIDAWVKRAANYPTPNGVTGWVAYRDELMALLSECSKGVVCSIQPTALDAGAVAFHVQLYMSFDGPDSHAHLPITEDADGLTCDICGAELADWAAADAHVEQHEGWVG